MRVMPGWEWVVAGDREVAGMVGEKAEGRVVTEFGGIG
jgi:hypothetical protein